MLVVNDKEVVHRATGRRKIVQGAVPSLEVVEVQVGGESPGAPVLAAVDSHVDPHGEEGAYDARSVFPLV